MTNSLIGFGQVDYVTKTQLKRDSIDAEFSDTATTILDENALNSFTGLHYFPFNDKYLIEATFKKKLGKPFKMSTSTNRLPIYRRYGVLTFEVDGVKCKLNLYQGIKSMQNDSALNDYLFCPFKDQSNTDSTYGGGRYLDFKLSDVSKTVLIDFNQCYNPYCAYSNRYSCPIPPKENILSVRIDAGVKKPNQEIH